MQINQASIAVERACTTASLADQLRITIGPHPDWVIVFHTGSVPPEFAQQVAKTAFPNTAIHGCSSSSAVFGGDGLVEDPGIGVLAITDPGGAFGTGHASFAQLAPADAARRAVVELDEVDAAALAQEVDPLDDLLELAAVEGLDLAGLPVLDRRRGHAEDRGLGLGGVEAMELDEPEDEVEDLAACGSAGARVGGPCIAERSGPGQLQDAGPSANLGSRGKRWRWSERAR